MTTAERNFSNFELGDNVYELQQGLIPTIADRLEAPIGHEPTSEGLQLIMNKVGTNKVLRDNAEIEALSRDEMADLVDASGIQAPLERSLWTPETPADWQTVDAVVLMGGVANWQDRAADAVPAEFVGMPVYNLAGTRVMNTDTETTNPSTSHFYDVFGRYPTEAEYAASIITPGLVELGYNVAATAYPTTNGDEILSEFFETNPQLLEKRIAVVRVANAGVTMALQLRAAAQKFNPDFDTDRNEPQTFVVTDTLPVARTDEQDKDSRHYQKASSALRQLVLTAKKLHEATNAE
ncbi:MAG: hypothetical protein QG553_605 [Patescibacteria group bacterium]|nr:hypothetical protein [Patescibacteria group bacterium]